MKNREREILVGKDRVRFGEDNIMHITVKGEADEKKAINAKEVFLKFIKMTKGDVNILIDLNKAGKPSPEARKIFREIHEHEGVRKVAHFGMHSVARVIASFAVGVAKKKDMRFFKTKEEALAWLKK